MGLSGATKVSELKRDSSEQLSDSLSSTRSLDEISLAPSGRQFQSWSSFIHVATAELEAWFAAENVKALVIPYDMDNPHELDRRVQRAVWRLTGFAGSKGTLVISFADNVTLVTLVVDSRYIRQAHQQVSTHRVSSAKVRLRHVPTVVLDKDYGKGMISAVNAVLKEKGINSGTVLFPGSACSPLLAKSVPGDVRILLKVNSYQKYNVAGHAFSMHTEELALYMLSDMRGTQNADRYFGSEQSLLREEARAPFFATPIGAFDYAALYDRDPSHYDPRTTPTMSLGHACARRIGQFINFLEGEWGIFVHTMPPIYIPFTRTDTLMALLLGGSYIASSCQVTMKDVRMWIGTREHTEQITVNYRDTNSDILETTETRTTLYRYAVIVTENNATYRALKSRAGLYNRIEGLDGVIVRINVVLKRGRFDVVNALEGSVLRGRRGDNVPRVRVFIPQSEQKQSFDVLHTLYTDMCISKSPGRQASAPNPGGFKWTNTGAYNMRTTSLQGVKTDRIRVELGVPSINSDALWFEQGYEAVGDRFATLLYVAQKRALFFVNMIESRALAVADAKAYKSAQTTPIPPSRLASVIADTRSSVCNTVWQHWARSRHYGSVSVRREWDRHDDSPVSSPRGRFAPPGPRTTDDVPPLLLGRSFQDIIAPGKYSAMPHFNHEKIGRLITPEDARSFGKRTAAYQFDVGGQYLVGTTDTSDVFACNTSPKETSNWKRFRRMYTTAVHAFANAFVQCNDISPLPPNQTSRPASFFSRAIASVIGASDFRKMTAHSDGHGIVPGGRVHASEPSIRATSNHKVTVGQLFTLEPGIYDVMFGGVRIERAVMMMTHGMGANTRTSLVPIMFYPFNEDLIIWEDVSFRARDWITGYQEVCAILLHSRDVMERLDGPSSPFKKTETRLKITDNARHVLPDEILDFVAQIADEVEAAMPGFWPNTLNRNKVSIHDWKKWCSSRWSWSVFYE